MVSGHGSKEESIRKKQDEDCNDNSPIEWLQAQTNEPLPPFFRRLAPKNQAALAQYVQEIIDYKTAGQEELYESIATALKYVPDFVAIRLCMRFIKPAVAAGITAKITIKQAVSLGNGMEPAYLAAVSCYLPPEHSARILLGLKHAHGQACLARMLGSYPDHLLAVADCLPDDELARLKPYREGIKALPAPLTSRFSELMARLGQVR